MSEHAAIAGPAAAAGSDKSTTYIVKPIEVLSVVELCVRLRVLQSRRRFFINAQSRCDRPIEALLASHLGYRASERDGKKIFAAAKKLRLQIETAGRLPPDAEYNEILREDAQLVVVSAKHREFWDERRVAGEAEMVALAKRLPVWDAWGDGTLGFGALGLAVVVAVTTSADGRTLSNYSTAAKVWKRCGVAVGADGLRQGRIPPGLTGKARAEAWSKRGYNQRNLAAIYPFLYESMLYQVWRGPKCPACEKAPAQCRCDPKPEPLPGYPRSQYGVEYARKKTEYLGRESAEEWSPLHCDNAARRYMAKCVLRDLRAAWQCCDRGRA